MKTKLLYGLGLLMMIAFVFTSSCKKKTDPPEPDYPQLIGTWSGNTWQNYPIALSVINVEGQLYLSSYAFAVTYSEPGVFDSAYYNQSNTSGIVPIINKKFSLLLYSPFSSGDSLWGTFDTGEMVLSGNIKSVFGTKISRGTYTAVKKTK